MKIAFIGGGNMASAIINGIVTNGFVSACDIVVSDPSAEKLSILSEMGIKTVSDNFAAADGADVVLFAVKPNILKEIIDDFKKISQNKLFISIAAGISQSFIKEALGEKANVIRVMPNTPAMVGEGMSVVFSSDADEKSHNFTMQLFSTLGKVCMMDEKYVHAVTALSGSGPAFVYMMIDAMAEGGIKCGLSREDALTLASQTVLGAAKMVQTTGEHPDLLKQRVCSPGGTTIEGVGALEKSDIRSSFIEAVEKSADKSSKM